MSKEKEDLVKKRDNGFRLFLKSASGVILTTLSLVLLYSVLMIIVFIPSNKSIENRHVESISALEEEGIYPIIYRSFGYDIQLDNYTDIVMLNETISDTDDNALISAFSINGYSRYWHGYLVVLRPLLQLTNHNGFRFINIMIFLVLLCLTAHILSAKFNYSVSGVFLLSMAMSYIIVVPLSFQYSSVFLIMMIALLGIFVLKKRLINKSYWIPLCIYFTAVGSITNFFDLLTAPLITLGIPLVVCILLFNKEGLGSFLSNCFRIIGASCCWFFGYAGTWVLKWCLAFVVLRNNIFGRTMDQVQFRLFGNEEFVLNRKEMFFANFDRMFPVPVLKTLIILSIVLIIVIIFFHKPKERIYECLPVLILAAYPYIWYLVLANHSHIHAWFTFRIQAVSVFSLFVFLFQCIDCEKLKEKLNLFISAKKQLRKNI